MTALSQGLNQTEQQQTARDPEARSGQRSRGWYRDPSGLHSVMYTQESAPVEVRDLTHLVCN